MVGQTRQACRISIVFNILHIVLQNRIKLHCSFDRDSEALYPVSTNVLLLLISCMGTFSSVYGVTLVLFNVTSHVHCFHCWLRVAWERFAQRLWPGSEIPFSLYWLLSLSDYVFGPTRRLAMIPLNCL